MEATDKVDPSGAGVRSASEVSLLFTWSNRVFALALRESQSCLVGRMESADVAIDDPSLSRAHARISLIHGQVTVEDLGSTNGCVLNGVHITCATVHDGDALQLGAIELRICARPALPGATLPVSHALFMRALAEEIARARLAGRPFTLMALKHDGQSALEALGPTLKPFDRWCPFAPTIDLLLMPELDSEAARRRLERALPKHGLAVGVASYPGVLGSAEHLLARALEACRTARPGSVKEQLEQGPPSTSQPVLRSPAMLRLYDLVARVARTTMPVLIHGETGAGKELVARALHDQSLRSNGPFRALNCATIPLGLIESVLFGHERGAFSGAERQTLGLFEQAEGGTVFLDEVGELSAQAQAALLRVLEQRRLVRLGATREISVDVRIVAATHRDLRALAKQGTFREDLLFRLDALTLSVPPLRERRDEILPLAEYFMAQARERWGAPVARISEDAREALVVHAWPGNVRQLRNVVERAVVVCTGESIELEDLPPDVWIDRGEESPPETSRGEVSPLSAQDLPSLPRRVRDLEVALIRQALDEAGGNQAQAARLLGIPRRTLASKVHAYRMVPART